MSSPQADAPHARRWSVVGTALIAALIGVVAAVGASLYVLAERSRVVIDAGDGGSGFDITGTCAEHGCTYLLLGSDSRAGLSAEEIERFGDDADIGGENRSDTIILVHVRPLDRTATFLSFPRDLWVDIPGHGTDKINAAFEGGIEGGGAQRVARTVTELTGLAIDHVLYVDLAGFQAVVEAIGGVDLCLPEPMVDPLTALDVPAGCQTLDGATALAYVRTRSQACDRIPDFARIARQQQFLRAVLSEVLAPSRVLQLPSLVESVLSNLVTDAGLNPAELVYLAGQLDGVGSRNADFRVVPTYPAWEGGLSIVRTIEPDASKLFERLATGRSLGDLGRTQVGAAPSPAVIRAQAYTLGVADDPGAAQAVLGRLRDSGFAVQEDALTSWGALERDLPATAAAILFRPGSDEGELMARVVRRFLGVGIVVAASSGSLPPGVDVAVVVGPRAQLDSSVGDLDCAIG